MYLSQVLKLCVLSTDPELAHEVLVSKFKFFRDRPDFSAFIITSYARRNIIRSGILSARGSQWTTIRAAVQPVFHAPSLARYCSAMHEASKQTVESISRQGSGTPFDIRSVLNEAALDIIFRCAYGVDLARDVRHGLDASICARRFAETCSWRI
jgi:cytochrome P450